MLSTKGSFSQRYLTSVSSGGKVFGPFWYHVRRDYGYRKGRMESDRFLHGSPTGDMVRCKHTTQRASTEVRGTEPGDLSAMSQEYLAMPATTPLPTAMFRRRGWHGARTS
jgi:hypothetical protein